MQVKYKIWNAYEGYKRGDRDLGVGKEYLKRGNAINCRCNYL